MLSKKWQKFISILPIVIPFLSVGLFPLLYSFYMSLTSYSIARPEQTEFIGGLNYYHSFIDPYFQNSIFVTFMIGIVAVTIEVLLGLGFGFLLNEKIRGIKLIRTTFLIPMMTPPIVVGLLWKLLFVRSISPLPIILSYFGLEFPNILATEMSRMAIVLVDVWEWTPFTTLIILSGIMAIPSQIQEAAQIDGVKSWQMFRYITLPLLVPVIVVAVIFRFITSLKMFDVVYVLTQGGPFFSSDVMGMYVFRTFFKTYKAAYASTASFIFMISVFILCIFLIRIMRRTKT